MKLLSACSSAVLATLLLAGPVGAQQPAYILRDLGTLPGDGSSIAWGINASGDVVGWSGVSPTRAFFYRDGLGMVPLAGLPGQTSTLARAINDAGVVVGSGWGSGLARHAIRWTGGVAEDLGVLAGDSEGWGVNRAGTTVGSSPGLGDFAPHAFAHSDGEGMVDITPAWTACAYDVNDAGQIAGSASAGAFLWSPGTGPQALGILDDFAFSHAQALNISGQVAGDVLSATGSRQRVIRYTPGLGLVNLGGVGEVNVAWGINAQGSVVGEGRPTSGLKRAFLYTDAAGLRSLNELVDASPQWFLLLATDINDAGQIVGYGFDNVTAQSRAFRLDPVTPVGPLAQLALNPVRIAGGGTATGWVTLTAPAPAGGAIVTLACDQPALASVPPMVLVSPGGRHASFGVVTANPASPSAAELTATHAGASRTASLLIEPAVLGVGGPGRAGDGLRLLPPRPNPAFTEARFGVESARPGDVGVRVHDVRGRLVRAFRLTVRSVGPSVLAWDLRDHSGARVPPGVYSIQLDAGSERAATRVVVLAP